VRRAGVGPGVALDAQVAEGPDAQALELGAEPLGEGAPLGVAVLQDHRQRRADERHAVQRALVQEVGVVGALDQLAQAAGRDPGGQQRPDDGAGRRARDPREAVAARLEHRHRARVPDPQDAAAGQDEVRLPPSSGTHRRNLLTSDESGAQRRS
jgi:hypothetical protein